MRFGVEKRGHRAGDRGAIRTPSLAIALSILLGLRTGGDLAKIRALVALALAEAGKGLLALGLAAALILTGLDTLGLACIYQGLLGAEAGLIQRLLTSLPIFQSGRQADRNTATEQQCDNLHPVFFHGVSLTGGDPR